MSRILTPLANAVDWVLEKTLAPLDRLEMNALLAQQARDRKEMLEVGLLSGEPPAPFVPAVISVSPHRAFSQFGIKGAEETGFLPVAHMVVRPPQLQFGG